MDDVILFDSTMKKKKKRQIRKSDENPIPPKEEIYTYDEMLHRVFDLIKTDTSKSSYVKPLQVQIPVVFKMGSKRVSWANFPQTCNSIQREPNHLMTYISTELGTTVNLAGDGKLVILGCFRPNQLESILQKYIAEYVTCKTCGSRDTMMEKENGVHFLKCCSSMCGSTRSVPPLRKSSRRNIDI